MSEAGIAAPRPSHRVRPAREAPRPDLHVVGPADRPLIRRPRLFAAITVALVGCGLFGLVAFHVVLTQQQLRLDTLEQKVEQQRARYDRQRMQVATLESPERIVARAQERIGMVPPPEVTYLSPSGLKSNGPLASSSTTDDNANSLSNAPVGAWPTVKAELAGGAR